MTNERAAALASARRHLDPDAAAAQFRFADKRRVARRLRDGL